jgi:hypothetical protein
VQGPVLLSRARVVAFASWCALGASACFGGTTGDAIDAGHDGGREGHSDAAPEPMPRPPFDAGNAPYEVELGTPGADGGSGFHALSEGGGIPIGGTGQAGLTARLALRLRVADAPDGGAPLERALVHLSLFNAFTGVEAPSKPWDVPDELICDGDVCDQPLVLVEISHLAKLPELPGLPVWIEVSVLDADDETRVLARANGSGVLERI